METLFLNYSPLTGFSVKTYRGGSWFNDDLAGFVKDSSNNVSCCIELKSVKEGLISINSHEWCCFPEDRDTIDEILAEIREAIDGY